MQELNKDLMASSLAPMVLLILKRQESYGYEIIQQLREKSGGELAVAEGTLYPVLKKMEEKKWLRSNWKKADTGRERKYYAITDTGLQELGEQLSQWDFINNLIIKLWKPETSI